MVAIIAAPTGMTGFLWADEENSAVLSPGTAGVEAATKGLNTDRRTLGALQALRAALQRGNSDTVRVEFRRLRTSEPHLMVPGESSSAPYVPLYRALQREFYRLQTDEREQHLAGTSAAADQLLDEILRTGSTHRIPELIQRAPGTEASLRAQLLVARLHFDRQNNAAAKVWLNPLLLNEVPERYRKAAAELAAQVDATKAQPGSKSPKSANKKPAQHAGTIPAHRFWQYSADPSTGLRKRIAEFRDSAAMANVVAETVWEDKIDETAIYRKTVRGLVAVDRKTGLPRWQYPLLPGLDHELSTSRSTSSFTRQVTTSGQLDRFHQLQHTELADAFCRDNVYGRVSADDRCVYLVTTDTDVTDSAIVVNRMFGSRQSLRQFRNARLVALEKSTGRRVWSAGLESFRDFAGADADSLWIAGPPIVSRNQLYCVAEWHGETRLVCLAASTGEIVWSFLLAYPDQAAPVDSVRRLWGAVPVVRQGLIWCPTTSGWTACVDELTRSVVWTQRIFTPIAGAQAMTIARGRPVAITAPTHVFQRWPASSVEIAGDNLLVVPHESHEIAVVSATTGIIIQRVPVKPGTLLLHADEERIVLAEQPSAVRWSRSPDEEQAVKHLLTSTSVATGKIEWTHELSTEEGFPTGRGVVRHGRLLLAMTTGRIAAVDMKTGKPALTAEVVLPVRGWGHLDLFPDSDDEILYSAPDLLLRLSNEKPDRHGESPVALATTLMASEKWEEALALLNKVTASDTEHDESLTLAFRCRHQLASLNPDKWMASHRDAARTPEEKIRVQLLEIDWLRNQEQFAEATEKLIGLLKNSPALLAASHISDSLPQGIAELNVQRSFLYRATNDLAELLSAHANDDAVHEQLAELPVEMLLKLNHASVRPLLHSWLETAELSEMALQVIFHCIDLAKQEDGAIQNLGPETDAMARFLETCRTAGSSSSRRATANLLNTMIQDLPSSLVEELRSRSAESDIGFRDQAVRGRDLRQKLQRRFENWKADHFVPTPVVRRPVIAQNSRRLVSAVVGDSFLNRYAWSAVRSPPHRLRAVDLAEPQWQWSIPGTLDINAVGFGQTDLLRRAGSKVLLHSYQGLTAISVVDQKVAWSHYVKSGASSVSSPGTQKNFQAFVAGQQQRPGSLQWSHVHVVAFGSDWVCIRHENEVKILETLSGSVVWSIRVKNDHNQLITTDDVLLVSGTNAETALCYDRRNGTAIELPNAGSLAARAITHFGSDLVCWKSADAKSPASLQWINPITGMVSQEAPLPGMSYFHFADDATLVGFNNKYEMLIVDLHSGATQKCSFSLPEEPEVIVPETKKDQEADGPLWSARRLQLSADVFNYYVTNRPVKTDSTLQLPSDRQMTLLEGGIRAVARDTGSLRWALEGDQTTLASTDQPELALLILVESQKLKADDNGSAAALNTFRGINRLSGRQVFNQAISSQLGLRYTQISSRRPDSIDLSVHGQSIRLTGNKNTQED